MTELINPEDARPFLADPDLHWKKGYSACELATSWIGVQDIPPPVRMVLERSPDFAGARLITGILERQTDLRTPGRPSQTDLLAIVWLPSGVGVIGVEGKCEESFGPIVSEWNTGEGRARRLAHLCDAIGLPLAATGTLRYQLIHRTAAALFEAQRFNAQKALMLVHSFSAKHSWFGDFTAFATAMSMPIAERNQISGGRRIGDVELSLGWIADRVAS